MKKLLLILVSALAISGVGASALAADPVAAPSAPAKPDAGAKNAAGIQNGIKLRVVAVNPSKEKTQKVPIRIFLPKEVIPDDIVDMGELRVGYDSEKGVYYAYSDGVDLKPQETRVFEVVLEDVWRVKDEDMQKVRDSTQRALKMLEKTEHFPTAKTIVDSIERRLNEIQAKQDDLTISREDHMGAHRVNLLVMQQIKRDCDVLEKMLLHTGAPPSIELLKDTPFENKKDLDRITAWKLILGIIAFLGLLGGGFYLRWFLLAGARKNAPQDEESAIPFISEHVEPRARPTGASEERKAG